MKHSSLSWRDGELLLREGRAMSFREYTLPQITKIVRPALTLTQNINKLYKYIRLPWTNGKISSFAISYYHPIYIIADQGNFVLKMDKGIVEKVKHPGALEFRHFNYLERISKPVDESYISVYTSPYNPESVQGRINYMKRKQNEKYLQSLSS